MRLHSTLSQAEWDDLLYFLTAKGTYISYIAETDSDRAFVYYKYVLVEYNGEFYYMQNPTNMFEPFTVTRYSKVSPYIKHQSDYPREVSDTEQLLAYMNEGGVRHHLKGTHDKRIYLTELYGMRDGHTDLWHLENKLAGYREKTILDNLAHITMQRNTKDYCVLRFHSSNGDWFDYETKSKRITL